MSMEDLIKQMLGGATASKPQQKTGADPLADLLGGILGGVTQQQSSGSAPQGAAGGGIADILGGIMGGADGKMDAGDLAGILGGILGGGAAAQSGSGGAGTQPSAGGLGDILGGILGAGGATTPQPSTGTGGLGGILGAILGSGGSGVASNSFLAPIANALAERLNLSPAIAQMVVSYVVSKFLPSLMGRASAQATPQATRAQQKTAQQGLDLDYLLDRMGQGQAPAASYMRSSGMAKELAEQTGLDSKTAARSLQEVFGILGGQLGASKAAATPKKSGGLEDLLDTWGK